MQPKVFISYSWTTSHHQSLVQQWADRLIFDGVHVILDIYDLKEGHDKYAFMEKMVNDPTVTHVLAICDKAYAEKADQRKAGVGTESQIISQEVYEKVDQSKFIPVVCEFDDAENPFLPTFFKSRIWIDFSSPEKSNENWERLIRLLYGKPLHEKPVLGAPPAYLSDTSGISSSPSASRLASFKQAIMHANPTVAVYRSDFLSSCLTFADNLRVRDRPQVASLGKKVIEDCGKLRQVRNQIVDWVILESRVSRDGSFSEILIDFLEKLRELKSRPDGLNTWNDVWFEAHSVFIYETFLYIVAALLKTGSYTVLHEVFTTHYIKPQTERHRDRPFETFACFAGDSKSLQAELSPPNQRLYCPAAELIKRQADRSDILFESIIEAELVIFLAGLLNEDARWYPQTLHYAPYHLDFDFFVRATQEKHFKKLALITGIENADHLREGVRKGLERIGANQWCNFHYSDSFWNLMNMDKLNTK